TFNGSLNVATGRVFLSNNNAYAGSTTVGNGATLTINSLGSARNTSGISVSTAGTLTIDNSNATTTNPVNLSNRLSSVTNKPSLTLSGSNFNLTGSTIPGAIVNETLTNLNLAGGNSIITQNNGTATGSSTLVLSATTLNRSAGATVNFVAGSTNLGTASNRIL